MIQLPNIPKISNDVAGRLVHNHPKYGNSWIDCNDNAWWFDRASRELGEARDAKLNHEIKSEIIDTIAVLMMWHDCIEA